MFRLVIHIPVGLLTVILVWANAWLGALFGIGFLAYEFTQGGEPYRDIKGWLWGTGIAGAIYSILKVVGIL